MRGEEVEEAAPRMVEEEVERDVRLRARPDEFCPEPDQEPEEDWHGVVAAQDDDRQAHDHGVAVAEGQHAQVDEREAAAGVRRHNLENGEPP